MTGMPKYWLEKIPALLAMDRYFHGDPATLEQRYRTALTALQTKATVWRAPGDSIAGLPNVQDAMDHFGRDWINTQNPNSGGNYWPHIPTWVVLTNLKQGITAGVTKALGWNVLANDAALPDPNVVFAKEVVDYQDEGGMHQSELLGVVPMVTCWVCTSGPGTGGFQVDAVRGPSVVEVVIATPMPMPQSRIWDVVGADLDRLWTQIHSFDVLDSVGKLPPWPATPDS